MFASVHIKVNDSVHIIHDFQPSGDLTNGNCASIINLLEAQVIWHLPHLAHKGKRHHPRKRLSRLNKEYVCGHARFGSRTGAKTALTLKIGSKLKERF